MFGKDVKLRKKEMSKKEKEKDQKKKKFLPEVIDELDKHNRPVQKVQRNFLNFVVVNFKYIAVNFDQCNVLKIV